MDEEDENVDASIAHVDVNLLAYLNSMMLFIGNAAALRADFAQIIKQDGRSSNQGR